MSQEGPGDGDVRAPVPSAPTEGLPEGFLAPGQVLGDRYQIKSQLGRGGMGEVWRAFDLKLRVEVALKAMLPDLFKNEKRRDLLRREVRAAREVVSPNVCRIFDLIEVDGRELVSMEYVDGGTLLSLLAKRGPLDLKEAQDIASQFLAGLEAIHQAGLVHRDVKPENIMITRTGRVVLMDFGLARQEDSGAGTVSGTPAYMAPEQAAGLKVDARADVYSAGVVLAEMVSPEGIRDLQSRQSVWEGIRHDPPRMPDSPWAPVLKKAVAKDREGRYNSAHTLTRALENVTLRIEGAEDLHPYPGLASFTEEDAEYFFGREAEVEQMWAKVEGPARLLGLVGPSGAGKTSFLRAGMIPNATPGWSVVRCSPGTSAMASLRRALVPALGCDTEALSSLATGEDEATISACSRWRAAHERALLIVDQFEELFTLNSQEAQAGFANLLRRLPLEIDVHVVLAMRDDFLMECNRYESLRPIVPDLTLLDPPTGGNLRRALVQPAMKCGYRFEDDELVDEMLAEVEGERGALPLLAFAAARLWEKRDRGNGLLTRQAYQDIGGVGGALARHAESTIDRIGVERIPIVRELFRNLVTAEGTRAVREWNELLSVFGSESTPLSSRATRLRAAESRDPHRVKSASLPPRSLRASGDPSTRSSDSLAQDDSNDGAAEVLRQLIDARLLTSYEVREEDCEPIRRVEIIHESLLANWPRLVRWQTQDADAAQLRDQLRQAARTWDEHDRTRDYLWTGRAYREFALWRGAYPGGLTSVEEDFAAAMTKHNKRRKRRRRVAAAAAFVALLAVLGVVVVSRQQAIVEANRAEAAKLLALGRLELDSSPTETLAYATRSLELDDSDQARRLALEALAAGPPATLLRTGPPADEGDYSHNVVFSPDGAWAALEGFESIRVVNRNGSVNRSLEPMPQSGAFALNSTFGAEGGHLFGSLAELRVWSVPEFQLLGSRSLPGAWSYPVATNGGLFVMSYPDDDDGDEVVVSAHTTNGDLRLVGRAEETWPNHIDREGKWFAFARDNDALVRSLHEWDLPPRRIGSHDGPVCGVSFAGDRLAAELESGEIWIWPIEGGGGAFGPFPTRERGCYSFDDDGDWLGVYGSQTEFSVAVWDLRSRRRSPAPRHRFSASVSAGGASAFFNGAGFVPGGDWLVTAHVAAAAFWPLRRDAPRILAEGVVSGTGLGFRELAFTPDGRSLVAIVQDSGFGEEAKIKAWDLETGGSSRTLASVPFIQLPQLAMGPRGRFVAVSTWYGVALVPLAGGPVRRLEGYPPGTWIGDVAVDADGRRVAACVYRGPAGDKVIRIWDLEKEEVTVLGPIEGAGEGSEGYITGLGFLPDGSLVSSGQGGLRLWNVRENSYDVVAPMTGGQLAVFGGGRYVARVVATEDLADYLLQITDLGTKNSRVLPSRITNPSRIATDPKGTVVVSAAFQNDGAVQVGRVSGGEPHLLLGHQRGIRAVAVSPDGRWIASAGHEGSIRLWPTPDLSKPPLHTLPHDELIAKLKTLTNLRVVRDEESSTGWKVEVGPFPGWETVPEW